MVSEKKVQKSAESTQKKLDERIKEMNCLYNLSGLDEIELTVEEIFEKSTEFLQKALQYPELAEVRFRFDGREYQTAIFNKKFERISTVSKRGQDQVLRIDVWYSIEEENHPEISFLKEERAMLQAITDLLGLKLFQKKINTDLKESLQRYELVTQATSDAIWDYDPKSGELIWGEGFHRLFGYKSGGKKNISHWFEKIHPSDKNRIEVKVESFIQGDINRWDEEYKFKKADGSYAFIYDKAITVYNDEGELVRIIGAMEDITGRKIIELRDKLSSDISKVFNSSESTTEALNGTLHCFYSIKNFAIAEFWLVDNKKESLVLTAHLQNTDNKMLFYKKSEQIKSFKKGEGMPGKTWHNKQELFWRNLDSRKTFVRNNAARITDIKTAFSFPLMHDDEVFGVLLLAVHEDIKNESHYLPLFRKLSDQIGHEISRKKLEEELSRIFMSAPDIICIAGLDGYYKKINPAMSELLGYSEKELLNTPIMDFVHPLDKQQTKGEFEALNKKQGSQYFENRHITKSGKVIWISWTTKPFYNEGITYSVGKDVTEQKELEELLNQANRLARIGSWEVDLIENTNYWSDITKEIHEVPSDFTPRLEKGINFYKEGQHREKIKNAVNRAIENGKGWDLELKLITAKGNERWIRAIGDAELVDGKCVRLYGSFQDIDHFKKTQLKTLEKTRKLDAIANFNSLLIKSQNWETALDKSLKGFAEVVDADRAYYFENSTDFETDEQYSSMLLEWVADGFISQIHRPIHQKVPFNMMGEFIQTLEKNQLYSAAVSNINDDDFKKILTDQHIKSVLAVPVFTGNLFRGFLGFDDCRNERKWRDDEISFFQTIAINLSSAIENKDAEESMKELNRTLEKRRKELEISNSELEQFAFVASHDLQEPLRMITSFLAQLERKYYDVLDEKGHQYIHFATDGAKRMREIILDLLDYSRVGRIETEREEVELEKLIQSELRNYKKQIRQQNATVTWENLPVIIASAGQIRQLFHNLIGNGLKYQSKNNPPEVIISAEETDTHWKFSVRDNGIGIKPEYSEKIFKIFQRLHTRDEYDGTGVGLAICKKVVEDHGGEIWVESKEREGSTFHFTIAKNQAEESIY